MAVQTLLRDTAASGPARSNGDVRRYRRVPLELAGRFMRSNRDEHSCVLKDISVGGAFIESEIGVAIGERVIAHFEHIGGLEGVIAHVRPGGFAVQFKISEHKREKLAAQIMGVLNRADYPDDLDGKNTLESTTGRKTTLRFDDGIVIDVGLQELSESGASVSTPARPPIGEEVTIAKIRAVVRRHNADGIGLRFFSAQDQSALRAMFP